MKRAAFYCGGKAAVTKQKDLKSFARYVSLSILGMLGMSCYILADTFFISQGIARALILSAANLLREREAQQIVTQIYSRSQAQTGLVKALGGTRRRIVTILPSIDIR